MKNPYLIFRFQLLVIILTVSNFANGQIGIQSGPDVTPEEMVEYLVGEGIVYSNVTFQGSEISRGIFTNGHTTNLGIESGIFFTSGAGYHIPGPNYSGTSGANNGMPGHPLLDQIISGATYDASVLEFDFIPESDTLKLRYVFGSEEYNEYVGNLSVSDVFGLFVTGPDPSGGEYTNRNIALVPGTTNDPITIQTINNGNSPHGVIPAGPCTNCAYYADNTFGVSMEYDGFTTVLRAWLTVVPCEEYHIVLGIADGGDGIVDSGVFLEENSISAPAIEKEVCLNPPGLTEHMVEGHLNAEIVLKLPHTNYAPMNVYFENVQGTGYATNGMDYEEIGNSIIFEEGHDSVSFQIIPWYDGIMENDELVELIIENTLGCEVRYDTIVLTILDYHEMISQISPNQMICPEQEVNLWVNVSEGFPPYTYHWEPGNQTNDSIWVSPSETTNYFVTAYDVFQESIMDSTLVTVLPGNLNDIFSFSFEANNNPQLQEDIIGQISGDSVILLLPLGTNAEYLIATFNVSNCALAYVDDLLQQSGATPNDFSLPVNYQVTAHNGDVKNWLVIADEITGINGNSLDKDFISICPNPSRGEFVISSGLPLSNPMDIRIMDLTGNIVFSNSYKSTDKVLINLSDQPKGLYFLQFKSGERIWNEKLIIQ